MKVAPLIHCRTYKCDYNAGFLARPNDFFDEEIQKARNYVVHATASIDSMKGNRWMVVNIGTHCIAGYIGYISDLAEQLNDEDLKIYSCDEQGRRIFAFIGFAVQEKSFNRTNDALQVTSKQLGDWLKAYLSKKWEKTVVDSQLTSYDSELSPCDEVDEDLGRSETIQNYIFYESNPYYDEKRFQYYLKQALRGDNVRFCSYLNRLRDVENTIFTTVTTSVNVIRQMKEQLSEREHKRSSKSQVISDGETESKKKHFSHKKNSARTWKIALVSGCMTILLLIIIMIIKAIQSV